MIALLLIIILSTVKLIENNYQENFDTFSFSPNLQNAVTYVSKVRDPTTKKKDQLKEALNNFFDWLNRRKTSADKIINTINVNGTMVTLPVAQQKIQIYQSCGLVNGSSRYIPKPGEVGYDKFATSYSLGIGEYILNTLSPKIDRIGAVIIPYGLQVELYERCNFSKDFNNLFLFTDNLCINENFGIDFEIASLRVKVIDPLNKTKVDYSNISKYYNDIFSENGYLNQYAKLLYDDVVYYTNDFNLSREGEINDWNWTNIDSVICNNSNTIRAARSQNNTLIAANVGLNQNINRANDDETWGAGTYRYQSLHDRRWESGWWCKGGDGGWCSNGQLGVQWDNGGNWRGGWICTGNGFGGIYYRNTWTSSAGQHKDWYRYWCCVKTGDYNNWVNTRDSNNRTIETNNNTIERLIIENNRLESTKKGYPPSYAVPSYDNYKTQKMNDFLTEYSSSGTNYSIRATLVKNILNKKYADKSDIINAIYDDWIILSK